jgi:hypothetical protein
MNTEPIEQPVGVALRTLYRPPKERIVRVLISPGSALDQDLKQMPKTERAPALRAYARHAWLVHEAPMSIRDAFEQYPRDCPAIRVRVDLTEFWEELGQRSAFARSVLLSIAMERFVAKLAAMRTPREILTSRTTSDAPAKGEGLVLAPSSQPKGLPMPIERSL